MKLIDGDWLVDNMRFSDGIIGDGGYVYVRVNDVIASIMEAPEVPVARSWNIVKEELQQYLERLKDKNRDQYDMAHIILSDMKSLEETWND